MFVCSRYIITVCTSIRAISLYTEDGEKRWLPEGIPGITLLCLSVVDILLLFVPISLLPVYIQKMKYMYIFCLYEFKMKILPFPSGINILFACLLVMDNMS